MIDFPTFAQAVVNGILIGGIYGLVSIGVTLIFGVVKFVNFAHGEFLMLAMYATWILAAPQAVRSVPALAWWPAVPALDPLISMVITVPLLFGLGMVVQQTLFRRVIGGSDLPQIFLTFALALLLTNLAVAVFKGDVRTVTTPYTDAVLNLGGVVIIAYTRLIAFGMAVLLTIGLSLFLTKTDIGQAMRAAAQDRDVAMLVAINPDHIYRVAVGLATALAAAGGALVLPFSQVQPHVGTIFGLKAFAVVIVGTLGSVRGAFLAGLLIGIAESLGIQFVNAAAGLIVVYVVLLATLILRPGGLFGAQR